MKEVAVLGAGISGLHVCYKLQKLYGPSLKIVLFEASEKIGGWIQTVEKEGFLFECGPRSLRSSSFETVDLIEELDLKNEVILASPSCRHRFILDHTLQKMSFFKSPLLWRGLWNDLWAKKGTLEDETVFSFVSRRFGEEVANLYLDPLIKGIYGGDMRKLSLRSSFPHWFQAEKNYRSLFLGLFLSKERRKVPSYLKGAPFFSFKKGLKTLPEALFKKLDVEVRFKQKLTDLREFSHVFSTLPSYELFPLLKEPCLLDLPFQSISTVSFGFDAKDLLEKKGFGYLVRGFDRGPILGCVFDSEVFPEQNRGDQTRVTFMLSQTDLRDEELFLIGKKALLEHLGIRREPSVFYIGRNEKAIPQYPVNHHLMVEKLKNKYPKITFLGTSFCGVSVNDCLKSF